MNELKSTREYQKHLKEVLKLAQQRLSARDFEAMATGVRTEILRLDSEIAELEFSSFMGMQSEPVVPTVIKLIQRVCLRHEKESSLIAGSLPNQISLAGGVRQLMQTSHASAEVLRNTESSFAMSSLLVRA